MSGGPSHMLSTVSSTWLPWILKFLLVLLMIALSRRPGGLGEDKRKRTQVVVLGDVGRSPRMQYHALSIAKYDGEVDLIGYLESEVHPEILKATNISLLPITPFPTFLGTSNRALFALLAPLKVIFQVLTLWRLLCFKTRPCRWMLVQNPPSIPTLAVALLVCWSRDTRLVIDWHNFGYSILSIKLGPNHPLVHVARRYERLLGRFAFAHFCVTDAMERVLKQDFNIISNVHTLHDRPTLAFRCLDEAERWQFLESFPSLLLGSSNWGKASESMVTENAATELNPPGRDSSIDPLFDKVQSVRSGHARMLVSATSWTPDEDFDLLLSALQGYCQTKSTVQESLPELLVIVTGKGPQKKSFEDKVANSTSKGKLRHATIVTAYFDDIEDYAKLLACADVGVSLHTSSSGVDLPMKVVDMFGAGLPVVGWDAFEAWPELVQDGSNGLGFKSAAQLQKHLESIFVADSKLLKRLKKGALEECKRRWDDEWDAVAGSLFGLVSAKKGARARS